MSASAHRLQLALAKERLDAFTGRCSVRESCRLSPRIGRHSLSASADKLLSFDVCCSDATFAGRWWIRMAIPYESEA